MKDIRFFNKDKKLMSGFKSVKIVVLRGGRHKMFYGVHK